MEDRMNSYATHFESSQNNPQTQIHDIGEQRRVEQALQHRLTLERLVAAVSTRILGAGLGQVEHQMQRALQEIAEAFGADHSFIHLLAADCTQVMDGSEWHVTGAEPITQELIGQSLKSFPWLLSRLQQFKAVHVPTVADIPAQASPEMEFLHREGLRAVSLIPLAHGEQLTGVFGLRTGYAFPKWDDADLVLLKLIGEILANMLLRTQVDERVATGRNLLRALIDNVPNTLYAKDSAGRFIVANMASATLVGMTPNEMLGKTDFDLFSIERAQQYRADEQVVISTEQALVDRVEIVTNHAGKQHWFSTTKVPLRDRLGRVVGIVGIGRDITNRKQAEEKLLYLSTHDVLTALYNRAYFEDALVHLGHGDQYPVSVVVIDIDGMKYTNDTRGHAAGDELLRRTAAVLKLPFREDDIVARIGGDEFAVLLPRTEERVALSLLDRLRLDLATHNSNYNGEPLSLSVGVATALECSLLTQTITNADQRMYRDKHRNQLAHPAWRDRLGDAHHVQRSH